MALLARAAELVYARRPSFYVFSAEALRRRPPLLPSSGCQSLHAPNLFCLHDPNALILYVFYACMAHRLRIFGPGPRILPCAKSSRASMPLCIRVSQF